MPDQRGEARLVRTAGVVRALFALRVVALLGVAPIAVFGSASETAASDGIYGRFRGDLSLDLGGGVAVEQGEPFAAGELRLRYLDTAGVVVAGSGAPAPGLPLFVGLEARPLFPLLFLRNVWTGIEWLDVFVQSLHVELGVTILDALQRPRLALGVGYGVEVPIVPPSWGRFTAGVRLGARHAIAAAHDLDGPGRDVAARSFQALLIVRWRLAAGVVVSEPSSTRRRW